MRHVVHHFTTICVSILLASFSVNKVCVLHSAYQLQRTKIEKEAWLRAQCAKPEFYANMRYHNSLCEEVEATARIGALWHALQEMAAGIPAGEVVALAQRLSWPFLLALALACLCVPSALISHMRHRHDCLPVYEGKHAP